MSTGGGGGLFPRGYNGQGVYRAPPRPPIPPCLLGARGGGEGSGSRPGHCTPAERAPPPPSTHRIGDFVCEPINTKLNSVTVVAM
jgi:hypothetical protein